MRPPLPPLPRTTTFLHQLGSLRAAYEAAFADPSAPAEPMPNTHYNPRALPTMAHRLLAEELRDHARLAKRRRTLSLRLEQLSRYDESPLRILRGDRDVVRHIAALVYPID